MTSYNYGQLKELYQKKLYKVYDNDKYYKKNSYHNNTNNQFKPQIIHKKSNGK
jgi:hypothetical protein